MHGRQLNSWCLQSFSLIRFVSLVFRLFVKRVLGLFWGNVSKTEVTRYLNFHYTQAELTSLIYSNNCCCSRDLVFQVIIYCISSVRQWGCGGKFKDIDSCLFLVSADVTFWLACSCFCQPVCLVMNAAQGARESRWRSSQMATKTPATQLIIHLFGIVSAWYSSTSQVPLLVSRSCIEWVADYKSNPSARHLLWWSNVQLYHTNRPHNNISISITSGHFIHFSLYIYFFHIFCCCHYSENFKLEVEG